MGIMIVQIAAYRLEAPGKLRKTVRVGVVRGKSKRAQKLHARELEAVLEADGWIVEAVSLYSNPLAQLLEHENATLLVAQE